MIKVLIPIVLAAYVPASLADWQMKGKDNGITSYTKEIDGSDFLAVRAEAATTKTVEELVAINTDASRLHEWMETFAEVDVTEKRSWFDYDLKVRYDFPFPFSDRISKTRTKLFQNGQTVYLSFSSQPLQADEQGVPMDSVRGFWAFRANENGNTDIVYQTHVEPGGSMSSIIANTFALDVPVATLKNLLERSDVTIDEPANLDHLPIGSDVDNADW